MLKRRISFGCLNRTGIYARLQVAGEGLAIEKSRSRPDTRFPEDEPDVWGGVPRRNVRFTGREDVLAGIYREFQKAPRGAAVCTLFGMSGVGKIEIAAEYIYRFQAAYDVVWWIPADQRGTLRQRLAELAGALGICYWSGVRGANPSRPRRIAPGSSAFTVASGSRQC